MDGVMREMKGKVEEVGVTMYAEGRKWVLNSVLFAENLQKMKVTYKIWSVFLIVYVKGES